MKHTTKYLLIILFLVAIFSSCRTQKDGCIYSKNFVGYGPGGYGKGRMK
jgi:hypothetical protein